ncbi:hypothetical protein [Aquabacterium humicola]|uniref:hypothetical protein n=1 Tax=Aquabacterium humicola TaxID=3237377 RepID=UPI0025439BBE|nr:hypothetical protein [Rubrivivax pictus]
MALMAACIGASAQGPAGEPPSEQPVRTLRDTPLTQSADGRQTLKYLVSCALPAGARVRHANGGDAVVLQGDLGLAPAWLDRGLDAAEELAVSACIFARTNHFARTVRISLRSDRPSAPAGLRADAPEQAAFDRFEAAFFGNLFAAQPRAYVCGPTLDVGQRNARERWLASHSRVCSLVIGQHAGRDITACGFIHVGECVAPNLTQEGIDHASSAIGVFLPAADGPGLDRMP